jgi:hypothetical protein
VLLDSAGAVHVLDPSFVQLSVFNPDGSLRARWGRRGSGPGEYTLPYSIAWLHDSVALLDPGNSRLMVLGPDGRWARQWVAQRLTGGLHVRLIRTPPRGFWMFTTRPAPDGSLTSLFVRFTSDGPGDTLVVYRPPEAIGRGSRCDRPDGGITFFNPPFGTTPLMMPNAAGEQVVAVSTAYRIAFLDAANDTLRVIERTVTPAVVSDAEWESELKEWREFREQWPTARCDRDSWARVTTKPMLEAMFVDDEGQLWVQVLTAKGRIYDVFGMDGRLRASVTGLPPTGGVDPSVVAGRIAFAVEDSNDVQTVQVFRIQK